jgi:hypothetical protein
MRAIHQVAAPLMPCDDGYTSATRGYGNFSDPRALAPDVHGLDNRPLLLDLGLMQRRVPVESADRAEIPGIERDSERKAVSSPPLQAVHVPGRDGDKPALNSRQTTPPDFCEDRYSRPEPARRGSPFHPESSAFAAGQVKYQVTPEGA